MDATQGWSWMDLEKSKTILKCLSLRGREGSSSQMGIAHLCGLKTTARKRRERGNSSLSLIFLVCFCFFSFLDAFSHSLTGTWKWGNSLWASGGTGIGSWQDQMLWLRWRSICASSYQMDAYSFPCLSFPAQWRAEQGWGDKLCLLCWQHG